MNKRLLFLLIFSAFGMGYSGFLSYSRLSMGVCLSDSVCPILLGYPVCLYGALGFGILLGCGLYAFFKPGFKKIFDFLYWFSLGCVLFALYYLVQEVFILTPADAALSLGYPSCLYGFIMFLGVFLLVRSMTSSEKP